MTSPLRTRIATVGLAGALLLGGSTLGSYAANGGSLLLGHKNTATKTTTLKNKKGTALSLKSKAGTAPFKVSNSTAVTNLNADLVDGKNASDLQNQSYVYSLSASAVTSAYVSFALPGLPAGKYLVTQDVSAGVPGAPTFVACFLVAGPVGGTPTSIAALALGVNDGTTSWFVSASDYVDTTTTSYRFDCQQGGGTSITIPAVSLFPARVTFTRVDSATLASTTGVGQLGPRGGGLGH